MFVGLVLYVCGVFSNLCLGTTFLLIHIIPGYKEDHVIRCFVRLSHKVKQSGRGNMSFVATGNKN